MSTDGKTVVFERDFGVWKLDVATGTVGPINIRLRGIVTATAPQRQTYKGDASDMAVSHDGRKVAVVVHGQVFAGPTVAGDRSQPAFRVTHTDAIESEVAWAHDDRRVAYVSTRDGAPAHLPVRLHHQDRDPADRHAGQRHRPGVLARRLGRRLRPWREATARRRAERAHATATPDDHPANVGASHDGGDHAGGHPGPTEIGC